MSSSANSQRQGQCDHCRIAWVWTLNIRLKDQVCAECGRSLGRVVPQVRRDTTGAGGYAWMTWEGYKSCALVARAT